MLTPNIRALYNEIDPYCCAWLSNLMDAGHITPGKIDDRPIQELTGADVEGYERVHFFAGIGGWDLALNLANWGKRFIWTGSCPCQDYSSAGKQEAQDGERHLWPAWKNLIRERKPGTIFGEQVANAITHGWLDEVAHDLETEGYAFAAAVLPACSVNAPHRRDRLWFVAHASGDRIGRGIGDIHQEECGSWGSLQEQLISAGESILADTSKPGFSEWGSGSMARSGGEQESKRYSGDSMADSESGAGRNERENIGAVSSEIDSPSNAGGACGGSCGPEDGEGNGGGYSRISGPRHPLAITRTRRA